MKLLEYLIIDCFIKEENMSRLPKYKAWKDNEGQFKPKTLPDNFSVKPCENDKCKEMTFDGKRFCLPCKNAYEMGRNEK